MAMTTQQLILTWFYRGVSAAQRFWAFVPIGRPEECWEWRGHRGTEGYGVITACGQPWRAHRLSWIIANGDIPKGMCVLHKCDNPPCVNPKHLFLGTRIDNSKDKVAKGRQVHLRGELSGNSKLTDEQVIAIRMAYSNSAITQNQLAKKYRVTEENIKHIIDGKTWCHVGGPRKPKSRWWGISGVRSIFAKLSEDDVRRIRSLARSGMMQKDIAILFHIDRSGVSALLSGKTYDTVSE